MTREETIKLAVKSLLEVVQTGAKNIEISVMDGYEKVTVSMRFDIVGWVLTTFLCVRTWILRRLRALSLKSNAKRKQVKQY